MVWGHNSNGEIGVGDSKVRNHPIRLETIEDKNINKVGVGATFAFAIGKTTTNRIESTIFDDAANRSQLSNDMMAEKNRERNNRSINSLED